MTDTPDKKNICCGLSSVCSSMKKLDISGNADWMALVLFVRNILNRLTVFSPKQRKELQSLVFSSLDQKNLSKENYDFIITVLEGHLEKNCIKRVRSQRDAFHLEKAYSELMEKELKDTLSQAQISSSKHGESFTKFRDKTVDDLQKGEKEKL